MHEWARGLRLPRSYALPGPFSTDISRYMVDVMAAIQNESVREVTVCKAIQTGGTLAAAEIPIAWALANAPGPVMWTQQTDKAVKEHVKGRFNAFLRRIPQIRVMMPPGRHDATTTEIYFGDFYLLINAANINSLQSKSIRWKFNTEVWLWDQGLLEQARGRVSKFEEIGTSKVVNESQASIHGDDFHRAYMDGDQSVWSVKCAGCGKHSPLEFFGRCATEPEKFACVVWNESARRQDGSWNVAEASGSARWKCPNCGHEHADTPRTRTLWNADGLYIPQRLDAPATHKSFRWTALVSRPLSSLVTQFLSANAEAKKGVTLKLKEFKMQRLSLFWKEEEFAEVVRLSTSGYLLASETIDAKIANESDRFLTIDRQRDHFWCVVRAWCADGSSRLLYRSKVQTVEQLEVIRERFAVQPQLVFEDSGYFPDGAYTDCVRYGWTALKGSGENYFTVERNAKRVRRMWSNVSSVLHNGKMIDLYHWASDPIKDVLGKLRAGQGAKWEVADDAGEEYERQLNGDVKKELINKKTGRSEWRWVRRHENHYWDCEAMQVAAALMLGILSSPTTDETESNKDAK
jgi:hypothetical protein